MNRPFLEIFANRCDFPEESYTALESALTALTDGGHAAEFEALLSAFIESGYTHEPANTNIKAFAERICLSEYTVWMLILIFAAESARPAYRDDDIYWASFSDFKAKLIECKDLHGVWGTFVPNWFAPRFFRANILKLGRLEYEITTYRDDKPYVCGNITVNPGDPVKNIHIPSNFGSLDKESRMDSYRKAYAYFSNELNGKPLICMCHSWLLFAENEKILPASSKILDFARDFDIIKQDTQDTFVNAWRVYGNEHTKPFAELPEHTSMQRGYKQFLLSGGKTGTGFGVLIFDGEKIINQ